ncbi:CaiB/BaiF CoA transferase family protein [Saccharopolyspora phatthalungensis]|uniref:Crotonobetainyl-CoA:carnitine CoA-transferase CaiB-like acyl-CoA transferase n=1 Tax=Saccharopolyspora phatthalungensis TaxID=664693 RepID=A0A840QBD7_9PSEU|nr:CoA transferase [Saccharopolyspora phatthalungensis]MBB5157257.1 crotonobetainyl-CoA:carnitine CoA-transferase CaiB-like acyl-CoA transferase [Saccharopolyspora phatthalungensis]
MRPLEGLTVVELGQYIAAPYCAMMLADLGADVIKIERPGIGDPRRSYDPLIEADGGRLSGGFLSYNRNKRSVTLNLAAEEGREIYRTIAARADVIVENLRPGAVDRLGIGQDVLRRDNDQLIYCAISGYGRWPQRRGQYSDRPAFDTAIQAMSGLMAVSGEPDGPPLPTVTGFADVFTAVHAVASILAALHGRQLTGRGCFVDQSMYDSTASLLERELMLWDFTRQPRRTGVDRYAALGTLQARDGHVALIIPTDEMWRRMCLAIEREDLLDHPKLDSVLARAENFSHVIRPEAEKWTRCRSRAEIVSRFSGFGLPAGEVQTVQEVYECPHLSAREMFLDIDDPVAGRRRMIRTPAMLTGYDPPAQGSAPQLGSDSERVLRDLAGATSDDLARWREANAI